MSYTATQDGHHGPEKGLLRWVKTTNHKDIGTLYMWFAFTMLLTSATEAATQQWSEDDLMAQGEILYNTNCAGCHMTDGTGGYGPAIKGSVIVNAEAGEHLNIVINGKNGMPSFRMLGDFDLAAAITYQRRAFGNTGSVVQPSDVTSAR